MFFDKCETLEELKKEFRRLAKMYHPDNAKTGDAERFRTMDAEYDKAFSRVGGVHKNRTGETYYKEPTETPEEYKNLIYELLKLRGVHIEIIGCFVWVSGETYPHRKKLKELGLRWSKSKSAWYRSPAGYHRHGKREYSMDDIRTMYKNHGKYDSDAANMEKQNA